MPSRGTQIYEGTNQVQRMVMARRLLKGCDCRLTAPDSCYQTGVQALDPAMLGASSGLREWVIEMSPLRGLVTSKREQVLDVAARHHANRVRLFGSVARGDDRPDSDIDFLVDFSQDSSLFDLMRMARDLEEVLGHRVDVVSTGGLKERDQHILGESIDL